MAVLSVGSVFQGGVPPPKLALTKKRIESEHQSVESIFVDSQGNIDVLSASIFLKINDSMGVVDHDGGAYTRTALFIRDATAPYIIDVNSLHVDDWGHSSIMSYWGNSSVVQKSLQNQPPYVMWRNLRESKTGSMSPPATSNRLLIQPFAVEFDPLLSVKSKKAREAYLKAARGEGRNTRVLYMGTPTNLLTRTSYPFTSVAFIRPLFNNAAIPTDLVSAHREAPGGDTLRVYQSYSWKQSETVVDVLVVRGAWQREDSYTRGQRLGRDIEVIVPEADSAYAYLPRNKRIGFARYVKVDSTWAIDSNYQLNIEEVLPLEASIGGPMCINYGTVESYSSRIINGKPPYSVDWYYFRKCPDPSILDTTCNAWNGAGTSESLLFGGDMPEKNSN